VIRSTLATSGPTDGKEGGYRRPAYPIHTRRPSLGLRKAPIRADPPGGEVIGPARVLPLGMLRGSDLKR
jgi:hypothetical protein